MDKGYELRIVRNFINKMPQTYRKRNINRVVIRDILMSGTRYMGSTSCDNKCIELGIDPYGYVLEGESNDE